jgi:hypothetical protein
MAAYTVLLLAIVLWNGASAATGSRCPPRPRSRSRPVFMLALPGTRIGVRDIWMDYVKPVYAAAHAAVRHCCAGRLRRLTIQILWGSK